MRIHLMAAAIRQVIAPPIQAVDQRNFWDNTVSQLVVDEGVIRDLKRAGYTSRVGNLGTGPFSKQSIQFNTTSQVRYGSSPFSLYGNFTIEGHVNFDSAGFATNTNQYIFDIGTNNFVFRLYNKKWHLSAPANTTLLQSTEEAVPDKWYHYAISRYNGVIKLFIDGVMVAQVANTASFSFAQFTWGNYGGGGYGLRGRMTNCRVVMAACYTENFLPPTSDLPAGNEFEATYDPYWDNVAFLSRGGVAAPADDKGATLTVTGPSAAQILNSSIYRFGPNAYFFNGDGTRASTPNTSGKFDFGSGDFTIEAWVRPTLTTGASVIQTICGVRGISGVDQLGSFVLVIEGNRPRFYFNMAVGGWSSIAPASGFEVLLNVWSHIVAMRVGNTIRLMVNGIQVATVAVSGAMTSSTEQLHIGSVNNGTLPFNGYIDSVRITKGIARYSMDISPKWNSDWAVRAKNGTDPERPANDDRFGQVSLSLPLSDTLYERRNSLWPTAVGSQTAFSGSKMLFGKPTLNLNTGANGDVAWEPNKALLNGMGSAVADFTVEGWINTDFYHSSVPIPLVTQWHTSSTGTWMLGVRDRKLCWAYNATQYHQTEAVVADGQWHHIAAVRKNGQITLFLDGVAVGTFANSIVYGYGGTLHVGGNPRNVLTEGFTMAAADIRVTAGLARYEGNFAVPTANLPIRALAA
ncbi:putative concanavalin A-like lectin/glucanases superfamily protein [Pseudomonas phage pPa_SNUABM_DT01]|nr:putative concanavalin A-like lectin/glucanases superfamily protein [Pseudomonas phage pPa_SNUABM_DT01]